MTVRRCRPVYRHNKRASRNKPTSAYVRSFTPSHGETINEQYRIARSEQCTRPVRCTLDTQERAPSTHAARLRLSTSVQAPCPSVRPSVSRPDRTGDGNVTNPYIMRWWANRTHSSPRQLDTPQTRSNTLPPAGRRQTARQRKGRTEGAARSAFWQLPAGVHIRLHAWRGCAIVRHVPSTHSS